MVNFAGSAATATFVNSMQLTAAIPASSIAAAGTPSVTVTNPAPRRWHLECDDLHHHQPRCCVCPDDQFYVS